MNSKETFTKIFLKQSNIPISNVSIKEYMPLWWQNTRNKEIEIGKELARQEGKPENMLDKIALGRLNKFFKENTLLSQPFIKDSKISVGNYIISNSDNAKVLSFERVSLS